MIDKVLDAIRKHRLIRPGQHVLVAVSGGADSVALLHALCGLARTGKFRVTAAHLNHGIRGKAAAVDARFVRAMAQRLGIPCVLGAVDVPRLARRRGISLEMAAREARYRFLAASAQKRKADVVATAHTADDQAETVLLKLARGAGAQGLGGISPASMRDGRPVVRPLLDVSRPEIVRYLTAHRLAWREDATNRDPAYLRNRVRNEVLPLLEERLNPQVRQALCRTAEILREENVWLDGLARNILGRCTGSDRMLNSVALRGQPPAAQRRALRLWLADHGFPVELIDFEIVEKLTALTGKEKGSEELELPDGWRVRRRYLRLQLVRAGDRKVRGFRAAIRVPGETIVPAAGLRVEARIQPGLKKERPRGPGHLPASASLGRLPARGALVIRSWHAGDRMRPFGLHGTRKVQDILVDAKVPKEERSAIPVVAHLGEIVWVPGYRIAEGWEVKDTTRPALQLCVERQV